MSRGSYESKATSVSTDTAMSAMPIMSPKPRAWTWLDDALRAMGASLRHDISKFSSRFVPGHLDSTTIVEASRSLSLRGTSGERAGERGTFHRIGQLESPLPYPLPTPPSWGEGREST